ncbi:hypothetical protein ACMSD6_25395, partial [Bacteroides thetaiotaomicron]|uniref:hypothetical protein n=1 Tax=Bacteroides thetaiotaomicron TaxID=818 RepID=UPI0039C100C9
NEHDKISFGCEDEESCVTSQQTSDSFFCPIVKQMSEQVLTITYNVNKNNKNRQYNRTGGLLLTNLFFWFIR